MIKTFNFALQQLAYLLKVKVIQTHSYHVCKAFPFKFFYFLCRLVQRESGLVSHVASLESQLQGYLKDGR